MRTIDRDRVCRALRELSAALDTNPAECTAETPVSDMAIEAIVASVAVLDENDGEGAGVRALYIVLKSIATYAGAERMARWLAGTGGVVVERIEAKPAPVAPKGQQP